MHGSKAQKAKYLPRLTSGEILGAWGLTEPGAGSDAAALRTRAEERDGGFVLNGEKAFITNGSVGGVAVVMARTDPRGAKGVSAFIVEKGTKGFTPGRPYRIYAITFRGMTDVERGWFLRRWVRDFSPRYFSETDPDRCSTTSTQRTRELTSTPTTQR